MTKSSIKYKFLLHFMTLKNVFMHNYSYARDHVFQKTTYNYYKMILNNILPKILTNN